MAFAQLGILDLIKAIQEKVEAKTEYRCYDAVPPNAASPFYYAEATSKQPANSKTMWRDVYNVNIHCIAAPTDNSSSVGIYALIQALQEALTEDIELPECFRLIMQVDQGLQTIFEEETKEKHAVVTYSFMVCYGFMMKDIGGHTNGNA